MIKEWFDEGIAGGIYTLVKRDGKFVMVTNFGSRPLECCYGKKYIITIGFVYPGVAP